MAQIRETEGPPLYIRCARLAKYSASLGVLGVSFPPNAPMLVVSEWVGEAVIELFDQATEELELSEKPPPVGYGGWREKVDVVLP